MNCIFSVNWNYYVIFWFVLRWNTRFFYFYFWKCWKTITNDCMCCSSSSRSLILSAMHFLQRWFDCLCQFYIFIYPSSPEVSYFLCRLFSWDMINNVVSYNRPIYYIISHMICNLKLLDNVFVIIKWHAFKPLFTKVILKDCFFVCIRYSKHFYFVSHDNVLYEGDISI